MSSLNAASKTSVPNSHIQHFFDINTVPALPGTKLAVNLSKSGGSSQTYSSGHYKILSGLLSGQQSQGRRNFDNAGISQWYTGNTNASNINSRSLGATQQTQQLNATQSQSQSQFGTVTVGLNTSTLNSSTNVNTNLNLTQSLGIPRNINLLNDSVKAKINILHDIEVYEQQELLLDNLKKARTQYAHDIKGIDLTHASVDNYDINYNESDPQDAKDKLHRISTDLTRHSEEGLRLQYERAAETVSRRYEQFLEDEKQQLNEALQKTARRVKMLERDCKVLAAKARGWKSLALGGQNGSGIPGDVNLIQDLDDDDGDRNINKLTSNVTVNNSNQNQQQQSSDPDLQIYSMETLFGKGNDITKISDEKLDSLLAVELHVAEMSLKNGLKIEKEVQQMKRKKAKRQQQLQNDYESNADDIDDDVKDSDNLNDIDPHNLIDPQYDNVLNNTNLLISKRKLEKLYEESIRRKRLELETYKYMDEASGLLGIQEPKGVYKSSESDSDSVSRNVNLDLDLAESQLKILERAEMNLANRLAALERHKYRWVGNIIDHNTVGKSLNGDDSGNSILESLGMNAKARDIASKYFKN